MSLIDAIGDADSASNMLQKTVIAQSRFLKHGVHQTACQVPMRGIIQASFKIRSSHTAFRARGVHNF